MNPLRSGVTKRERVLVAGLLTLVVVVGAIATHTWWMDRKRTHDVRRADAILEDLVLPSEWNMYPGECPHQLCLVTPTSADTALTIIGERLEAKGFDVVPSIWLQER